MSDLENQTENFALRTRMKPPVTSAQGNPTINPGSLIEIVAREDNEFTMYNRKA